MKRHKQWAGTVWAYKSQALAYEVIHISVHGSILFVSPTVIVIANCSLHVQAFFRNRQ